MKLNLRQQTRLREIARDRNGSHAGIAEVSTRELANLGLVEIRDSCASAISGSRGPRKYKGFAHVTEAGRAWIKENS